MLIIRLQQDDRIKIGVLGEIPFKKGIYAYVGSAQRNMEQRVKRHLRKEKRLFWHIDYLLNSPNARIEKVFYSETGRGEECRVVTKIAEKGEAVIGFGCSDCHCQSHLLFLGDVEVELDSMRPLVLE